MRASYKLPKSDSEDGFALLVLIVAIFVLLLFLGIAAPKVAKDLQREREIETVHRGNQYVRGIQLYYAKFKHYPGSMDQLEKSNNIRFLRQQYIDPLTGKADWRLIHVGENKTTVKGFFGQPLAGISTTGIGSSSISGTSGFGSSATGSTSSFGTSTGTTSDSSGTTGTGGAAGATGASGATGIGGGIGSQSASTFGGTGAPFMGVGNSTSGPSIITLNEQTDYSKWEFIYDPRIELLKAKSNILGGGIAGGSGISGSSGIGTPSSSFGTSSGTSSGAGTGTTGTSSGTSTGPATTPTTPQ
jgi:type II secretory pathway pseudopilin PulG